MDTDVNRPRKHHLPECSPFHALPASKAAVWGSCWHPIQGQVDTCMSEGRPGHVSLQRSACTEGEPVSGAQKGKSSKLLQVPGNILLRVPNAPEENTKNQRRNKGGLDQEPPYRGILLPILHEFLCISTMALSTFVF